MLPAEELRQLVTKYPVFARYFGSSLAKGEEPDNYLNPVNLNSLQRKMLKESFSVISRLQETIEFRFKTRVVEI
jgi:signal-transduction protein with cAMP-binding, CBS, and nucleotidyltransferase domain